MVAIKKHRDNISGTLLHLPFHLDMLYLLYTRRMQRIVGSLRNCLYNALIAKLEVTVLHPGVQNYAR